MLLAWLGVSGFQARRFEFGAELDAGNALTLAQNLVAGRGYTIDFIWHFYGRMPIPQPEDTWSPGYLTVQAGSLAPFGNNPVSRRIPDIVCAGCLSLLLVYISGSLYKDRVSALVTGALFLLIGPYQVLDILNNTLLSFLVTLTLFISARFAVQPRWAGAAGLGIVCGCLMLVNEDSDVSRQLLDCPRSARIDER
jgi:hypothetical protein